MYQSIVVVLLTALIAGAATARSLTPHGINGGGPASPPYVTTQAAPPNP
jgi:hypothetical protein